MFAESRPLPLDNFCRLIDNFGDAGVCLRLTRQPNARGHSIWLIIDDLAVLGMLAPDLH